MPHADLDKPIEVLLDELDMLSRENTSTGNPKANAFAGISAVRKFACILTILSRAADKQTRRIVRLTWGLLIFTAALLIFTVLLYQDSRTLAHRRYQLYSIEETASPSGKNVKSVYRLDTITGKTWRISSNPVQTESKDSQGNPIVMWPDGWEELPESPEAAVAKAQADYQRALRH